MRTLSGAGWVADLAATTGPGDARRLAAEGVAGGVEVVAVFGGDGTTMQAAAALVGTDVSLGRAPRRHRQPARRQPPDPASPARAAQALISARPRRFDLGRMQRADGAALLRRGLRGGLRCQGHGGHADGAQRRWGMGAYVATTLRLVSEIRSSAHVITIDGAEYDANAAMVLVANCGEVIPPWVRLGAGIRPDDGLLDVIVVRANGLGQSVRAVWDLLRSAPDVEGLDTYRGLRSRAGDPGRDRSGAAGAARRRARRRDALHRHGGSRGHQHHGAEVRVRWRVAGD